MSLSEIRQSVGRAERLLDDTGFLDMARGLNTDGWARNVTEARRELDEVADLLARRAGRRLYEQMGPALRRRMWRALLLAGCNAGATGEDQFDIASGMRIMRALGDDAPAAQTDLDFAVGELATRATGFPVAVLRTIARRFREAGTDLATIVERRARIAGDPAPPRPTADEGRRYCEVVLPAIRRARAIASSWEAQHPEMATFAAVAASVFGVPTDVSGRGLVNDIVGRSRDGIRDHLADATHTAGPLTWVGRFDAARTGVETWGRLTDPRERLRQCILESAIARSGNDEARGRRLVEELRNVESRMNAWFRWLDRHRDHPMWVPPGGVIRAASPTARPV